MNVKKGKGSSRHYTGKTWRNLWHRMFAILLTCIMTIGNVPQMEAAAAVTQPEAQANQKEIVYIQAENSL